MTKFLRRFPLLGSILVIVIFYGVMLLASLLLSWVFPGFPNWNQYAAQGMVEFYGALAAVGTVALFGYRRIWRERRLSFGRGLVVGLYFVFVSVYSLNALLFSALQDGGALHPAPLWQLPVFVTAILLIGFTEEVFFRGVVSNLFFDRYAADSAGVWSAVVLSGLVFGLMHLGNALGGADLGGVLVQAFVASGMGMALTAVYYRTRNLWVNVFLHALVDFCALFVPACLNQSALTDTIDSYSGFQFIGIVPYLIVTAVLLRKAKLRQILGREDVSSAPASRRTCRIVCGAALAVGLAILLTYFIRYGFSLPDLPDLYGMET